MAKRRARLWDSNSHRKYWESSQAASERATARKEGARAAQALDELWHTLGADERSFMEYLLLSGRQSVVALYEDQLFNALVRKGLLQVPAKVGTLLMQELETTFSVPRAVWQALQDRKDRFLPYTEVEATEKLVGLNALLHTKIRM
ncbi:MAG: hypothetical protein ACE5LB_02695 [Acidiferrobacterales bacterium]